MSLDHAGDSQSPSGDNEVDEYPVKKRRLTDGSSTNAPSNRRKTACQSCRVRKVKCDNVRPTCAICQSSGSECVYIDSGVEKLTLDSATALLANRLDQLQQSLDGIGVVVFGHDASKRDPRLSLHAPLAQEASAEATTPEASRDYLQIPTYRTTADTVLTWPVFEDKYPPNALISTIFTTRESRQPCGPNNQSAPSEDAFVVAGGLRPPEEERIPFLIDNFLQNVHTKNPILDTEMLVKHGRKFAEQGLGWDAWSCLVLLTCALGSVAKPFDTAAPVSPVTRPESLAPTEAPPPASANLFAKELHQGESCFVLACRRLGTLKHTTLAAQCYFFAGVYLMYTLRPLLSWQYFYNASIMYQLHLKTTRGIMALETDDQQIPLQQSDGTTPKQRRLEQCLYWSCFKSECEFRVELPLPQSEIANYDYPNLFPEPPSPAAVDVLTSPSNSFDALNGYESGLHNLRRNDTASTMTEEDIEIRQHAKRLCNEEESWYYYLTEVALRRIGNRIINTFFRQSFESWLNIKPLLSIALEFDAQVSSWSANLPPAMQHYQDTSTIRAPISDPLVGGGNNFVTRELSWATDNRLLEMRSWLYQPFLYYLIHSGQSLAPAAHSSMSTRPTGSIRDLLNQPLSPFQPEENGVLHHMIGSGIECNLKILDVRSLRHRHHGLWYDLRSTMTASLILLAVVKSGHGDLIPGGLDLLFGPSRGPHSGWSPGAGNGAGNAAGSGVGGKLGKVIEQFEFWAQESPDLIRHRQVLEASIRDVCHGLRRPSG